MKLPTHLQNVENQDLHDDWHNALHEQYNLTQVLPQDRAKDLQETLNKFGNVKLTNGRYIVDDYIYIPDNTNLIGSTNTVLVCKGIIANPDSKVYARVQIRDLTVNDIGNNSIGIDLGQCRFDVGNVTVNGFDVAVNVEYAISSHFDRLLTSTNEIGVLISGDVSTTVSFSNCTFNDSSQYAVKIEDEINSVSFDDWCVWQSSRYGLYVDGCSVVTLVNPYFENIHRENIVAGANSTIQSFTMINPIMVGGNDNVSSTDLVLFDRVKILNWLGGGDVREPKTSWIKTTSNVETFQVVEPVHLGLTNAISDATKGVIFRRNGRLGLTTYNIGNNWLLNSNYFLQPNDLLLSDGTDSFVGLYADTVSEQVNLASKYQSGNWVGGLEIRKYGLVIQRQSDDAKFLLTVDDNGDLIATGI